MNDAELCLAIGVPIVLNAAMFTIAVTLLGGRISSMENAMNAGFAGFEARFELLTGKVGELTDRVTRIEDRTERQ
ncbi:MAG: hypothetical protein ABSG65_23420 [Bryobacteraceae bacterium]|jgi:hypothetical protein